MNEIAEMIEATNELHPALRAVGEPRGIPITINGAEWLLAHGGAATILDSLRDRMDDQVRLTSKVDMSDVIEVARLCLLSNFELTEEEVLRLLVDADRKELVDAVMEAVFGSPHPKTYTLWMQASLYANGLRPDDIPAHVLPHVLGLLVGLKKTVPASQFTDAAIAAPRLRMARAAAESRAEAKAAEIPPAPSPEVAP
jgi:hypothetical protein